MGGIEATVAEFLHSLDVTRAKASIGFPNGHVLSIFFEHVKLALCGRIGSPKTRGLGEAGTEAFPGIQEGFLLGGLF